MLFVILNATMKRLIFLIVMITLGSCNTKQPEKKIPPVDTTGIVHTDSANIKTDSHYFWSSDWDPKKGLVMKRTVPISDDSLTATNILQKLNVLYPEIQLHFNRISNDSIFVTINKSSYLTQQIGSSGAEAYLAEVTYNLTELKDINFVDISFKEGDHASPGTYTRIGFVQVTN
jgi:hypothetical protein